MDRRKGTLPKKGSKIPHCPECGGMEWGGYSTRVEFDKVVVDVMCICRHWYTAVFTFGKVIGIDDPIT